MTQGWIDRVIFTAVSGGVADFHVGAAVPGYNTPALSSAVDGTSYHYSAQTVDHKGNITDWEVGTGVYTASTTTLTRVVELSSNSNALVSFTAPPQVMITALAADFPVTGGGGATPGTPVHSVQFNNPLGTFAGNIDFTWVTGTGLLAKEHSGFGNFAVIDQYAANPGSSSPLPPTAGSWTMVVNDAVTMTAATPNLDVGTLVLSTGVKQTSAVSGSNITGLQSYPYIIEDNVNELSIEGADINTYNHGSGNCPLNVGAYIVGASYCTGTTTLLEGSHNVTSQNAGVCTTAVAATIQAQLWGGTLGTQYGGRVEARVGTGGTVTNAYGFAINDWSSFGASGNNFNFWSQGASSLNYFEGIIRYGTAINGSPSAGDLWFDGTHFYFRHAGVSTDLLAAGGGGSTGANPTATASDVAVNGVATTFLRSDGAPAVQKTSAAQFGLCKVDGSTITSVGGVITSVGGAASLVVNSSPVTAGAAAKNVLFEDGTLREAAAFTIDTTATYLAGSPNLANGGVYEVDGVRALYVTRGGVGAPAHSNVFVGNSGNYPSSLITGDHNCGMGHTALAALTGGNDNIALGWAAGAALTTGTGTILIGSFVGQSVPTPASCVFIGQNAAQHVTGSPNNCVGIGPGAFGGASGSALGNNNVAIGANAGSSMTGGSNNCLLGGSAGTSLSTESSVTCVGYQCGQFAFGLSSGDAFYGYQAAQTATSSGGNNLGVGTLAFIHLAGGANNVALGANALAGVLGGSNNMGIGANSLSSVTSGQANVGLGQNTLTAVTSAGNNIAIGQNAGQILTGNDNTLIGPSSGVDMTTGSVNCIISGQAGVTFGITTGKGNTVIGNGINTLTNPSDVAIIASGATSGVGGSATIRADFGYTKANGWVLNASAGVYTTNANFMLRNTAGLTGGSTANTPTLTAGPVTGNPTKWLPYDDNGVTRFIPSW